MKAWVCAFLSVLSLAACGDAVAVPARTPSQSVAAVTPSAVTAPCRLPVSWQIFDTAKRTWSTHAGFLTVPGNGLSEDPAGVMVENGTRTPRPPYLRGVGPPRYINGRWLPGGVTSPDGRQYAYSDRDYAIHLVDVATADDRIIGGTGPWGPAGFTSDGLYLNRVRITHTNIAGDMETPLGLWVVNPGGGQPRKVAVSPDLMWEVAGKAAWGLDRPAGDPLGQGPDRLLRVDLGGGAAAEWFHQPQANSIDLVGFDGQGLPFVHFEEGADPRTNVVRHVNGPDQSVEVFRDIGFRPQGPLANDKRGTWFSGFGATEPFSSPVFLYNTSGHIKPAGEIAGAQIDVAGGCA